MKILRGMLLGSTVIWAGQAFAENTSSEIRELQARLKQLEQRVENQRRSTPVQAQAVKAPSAFDPCPAISLQPAGVVMIISSSYNHRMPSFREEAA